jgi:hypothetical protein
VEELLEYQYLKSMLRPEHFGRPAQLKPSLLAPAGRQIMAAFGTMFTVRKSGIDDAASLRDTIREIGAADGPAYLFLSRTARTRCANSA